MDHFKVIDSMWTQVRLKFVMCFVLSQHQEDDDETPWVQMKMTISWNMLIFEQAVLDYVFLSISKGTVQSVAGNFKASHQTGVLFVIV